MGIGFNMQIQGNHSMWPCPTTSKDWARPYLYWSCDKSWDAAVPKMQKNRHPEWFCSWVSLQNLQSWNSLKVALLVILHKHQPWKSGPWKSLTCQKPKPDPFRPQLHFFLLESTYQIMLHLRFSQQMPTSMNVRPAGSSIPFSMTSIKGNFAGHVL